MAVTMLINGIDNNNNNDDNNSFICVVLINTQLQRASNKQQSAQVKTQCAFIHPYLQTNANRHNVTQNIFRRLELKSSEAKLREWHFYMLVLHHSDCNSIT